MQRTQARKRDGGRGDRSSGTLRNSALSHTAGAGAARATPTPTHARQDRASPINRPPTCLRCRPCARESSRRRAERAPRSPGRCHSPLRWPSGRRARWREAEQTCYCRTYTGCTDSARRKRKELAPSPGSRACERRVPARPTGRALRRVRAQPPPSSAGAARPRPEVLPFYPSRAALASARHNVGIGCNETLAGADLLFPRAGACSVRVAWQRFFPLGVPS